MVLLALDASGVETTWDVVASTSELLEHSEQPCELARLAEVVAAGSCRCTVQQCSTDSAAASRLDAPLNGSSAQSSCTRRERAGYQ